MHSRCVPLGRRCRQLGEATRGVQVPCSNAPRPTAACDAYDDRVTTVSANIYLQNVSCKKLLFVSIYAYFANESFQPTAVNRLSKVSLQVRWFPQESLSPDAVMPRRCRICTRIQAEAAVLDSCSTALPWAAVHAPSALCRDVTANILPMRSHAPPPAGKPHRLCRCAGPFRFTRERKPVSS